MKSIQTLLLFIIVAIVTSTAHANNPKQITIGSKAFTENRLLAEMMAQLIESKTDIEVIRKTNLGGTTLVFTALQSGDIDLYPEYTGTGWNVQLAYKSKPLSSLQTYIVVKNQFKKQFNILWLSPFGFNNSTALAMKVSVAEKYNITKISDLKNHYKTIKIGFAHEFLNRNDGLPGLESFYGFSFPKEHINGIEHGLAFNAIETNKVDIIDLWTTDGKLLDTKLDLVFIRDDLNFFPPYQAAPIIRQDTLEKYPQIAVVLEQLAFRIDDATMTKLNHDVEVSLGQFEAIAASFLKQEGFITSQQSTTPIAAMEATQINGLSDFIRVNKHAIAYRVWQHLFLTLFAILLATILAVPLGIILTRHPRVANPVLGIAGVIQTIPSLAILAFLIPLSGLGQRSAIVAIFLYSILPILRNTYTAILVIDPLLLEAARGMGLTPWQKLRAIQIPLAMRTIMAGIRTATIIGIGITTLAAFIGAGGLGESIITGLQLNNIYLILSGAIPAALLAIVIDMLLARCEKCLIPKGIA